MTTVELLPEAEATGKVQAIYNEIMDEIGIDFVPNMYKAMAHQPDFLEAQWRKTQVGMRPGTLDQLTKEMIAVAVSAVSGCDY